MALAIQCLKYDLEQDSFLIITMIMRYSKPSLQAQFVTNLQHAELSTRVKTRKLLQISELYIYIWSKNFSHSVNEKSEAK